VIYARRSSEFQPEGITHVTIRQAVLAGFKEEPLFNWMYVYSVGALLLATDTRLGFVLSNFNSVIPWAQVLPLVPPQNAWAVGNAVILVSIYFGWRHQGMEIYANIGRRQTFIATTVLNMVNGLLNYSLGLVIMIFVHSYWDLAIGLLMRYVLKMKYAPLNK